MPQRKRRGFQAPRKSSSSDGSCKCPKKPQSVVAELAKQKALAQKAYAAYIVAASRVSALSMMATNAARGDSMACMMARGQEAYLETAEQMKLMEYQTVQNAHQIAEQNVVTYCGIET